MPYMIAIIFIFMGGFLQFISSTSLIERVLSVVIPFIICLVLIGMIKARNKRLLAENVKLDLIKKEKEFIAIKIAEAQDSLGAKPFSATVVGGSGYKFPGNNLVYVGLNKSDLVLISLFDGSSTCISAIDINEIEISGPGTVKSDAGIVGGGFGLEGFLKGAMVAAIINSATTRSSTNTFARILTKIGEIYLHTGEVEPDQLRLILSPIFVHLSNRNTKSG